MSNLINPKPRFGYHPDTDLIYDYAAQRDVAATMRDYDTLDGVWDLSAVKEAILTGTNLEEAHLSLKVRPKAVAPPPLPNAGTVAAPTGATPPGTPNTGALAAHSGGLSVAQLIALGLSALQCAALQITPEQLTATGVTAEQVANWALTPERAEALALTPAQRAVLLS